MGWLTQRLRRPPAAPPPAPPRVVCPHLTLVPRWDSAAEIGQADKASGYTCQTCGLTFTAAEARALRQTEGARVRREFETAPQLRRAYPRPLALADGTSVTLRLLSAADADRIVQFARSLPEDDLLFLRTDITDPAEVARWMQELAAGRTATVLAEASGELAGYASLHYNAVTWQRHLGEIRVQVGPQRRSRGLGRGLATEVFTIAQELGLRMLIAQMTADQPGAVATFERLGFQTVAQLPRFVVDRANRLHDLLVMARDIERLPAAAAAGQAGAPASSGASTPPAPGSVG